MPNINSSSLALRRKRLGYERKQIAFLLGHKTTHQLCRFETGQRTPSFKEAVKLSLLYKLPLHALLTVIFVIVLKNSKIRLNIQVYPLK